MPAGAWTAKVHVSYLSAIKRSEAQGCEGSSLTGAALGGRTFPSSVTVHPLGKPGYVVTVATGLFCRVVGTHG